MHSFYSKGIGHRRRTATKQDALTGKGQIVFEWVANPPLVSGGLQIRHSMSEKWGFFRLARALTPKNVHRTFSGALPTLHPGIRRLSEQKTAETREKS